MLSTRSEVQVNKHWVARLLWRPHPPLAGSCSWWALPGSCWTCLPSQALRLKPGRYQRKGKTRWPTFLQYSPRASPSVHSMRWVGWGVVFHNSLMGTLPNSHCPLALLIWLSFGPPRQFFLQGTHIAILSTFLRARPVRCRKGPEMHLPSYCYFFLRGIRSKRSHIYIVF